MRRIFYVVTYLASLGLYFLDKYIYPLVYTNASQTDETGLLVTYGNLIYVVLAAVVFLHVYLNATGKGSKFYIFVNIGCLAVSAVLFVVLQPAVLWTPDFLTLILAADLFNLVVSLLTIKKKA